MKKPFTAVATFMVLATIGSMLAVPAAEAKIVVKTKKVTKHISVSMIPGADEKNFADPVSRCVTASMKALNTAAVKKMNADIAKHPGHDKAAATYKEKMATVWYAMEEPYCGYGSLGLTAVKHSFQKSVDHIRTAFLGSVK